MDAKTDTAPIDVLEHLLAARFSCRAFLPKPVPRATIERILTAAQKTASWCNSQPWRLEITSGDETAKFRELMYGTASGGGASSGHFPFPREYRGVYLERRRESGFQLYNSLGIPRGDKAGYARQALENFNFFGAPHVAIVHTDEALGVYGAIDCGLYLTSFMLAAEALGVATIPQAALAFHAEAADDGPAVMRYAPAAAHQAAGLGAHREAVAQFERALRSAPGASAATSRLTIEYASPVSEMWCKTPSSMRPAGWAKSSVRAASARILPGSRTSPST